MTLQQGGCGHAEQPYLSVGVDSGGGACWLVVAPGLRVECWSGARAVEVLAAVCRARGLAVPG